MTTRAPWMPFYGDDFFMHSNVVEMNLEQQGAFLRLLWFAWRDGSIPSDPVALSRRLGVTLAKFRKLWPALEPCWNPCPDDPNRLVNNRLREEWERKNDVVDKRRAAGRKGGEAGKGPRRIAQ